MDNKKTIQTEYFWNMGIKTMQELETPEGILASDKSEIFGCIFGRDSLITSLKLLKSYEITQDQYFLSLVKKVLVNLMKLQGKETNIESGEQPGKCIHEYRVDNHEHLTKCDLKPWFVYPDNSMRNYDSLDATPLLLIATYRYIQKNHDEEFAKIHMPQIRFALEWILNYSDSNFDFFADYQLHPHRQYGGLQTQSWMDSSESVFHEDGDKVVYPIAPVEVQAYCFQALKLWASYFNASDSEFSLSLNNRAVILKKKFNSRFIMEDKNGTYLASGIDGEGKPIKSVRSSMGHVLWAALTEKNDGINESILERKYIEKIVKRIMQPDMFEPEAGIRTLSKQSSQFQSNSYHNGSIWPHDNSMIIAGLENFGFLQEAAQVRLAIMQAFEYFRTPLELFVFDGTYHEYVSPSGQTACKKQAWSTASLLLETAKQKLLEPVENTVETLTS